MFIHGLSFGVLLAKVSLCATSYSRWAPNQSWIGRLSRGVRNQWDREFGEIIATKRWQCGILFLDVSHGLVLESIIHERLSVPVVCSANGRDECRKREWWLAAITEGNLVFRPCIRARQRLRNLISEVAPSTGQIRQVAALQVKRNPCWSEALTVVLRLCFAPWRVR